MEKFFKTQEDKDQFIEWLHWLWADVLPQTRYFLNSSEGGYCCLGVACAIFIKHPVLFRTGVYKISGQVPSDQSKSPQWLKEINDDIYARTGTSLTELNDTQGKTFPQIADILYETYKDEL